MENSKRVSIDSVASEPIRKFVDSMAGPSGISDLLRTAEKVAMNDPMRRMMESVASDPARKFMDSMAAPGGISDLLKSAERVAMNDPMRRMMENGSVPGAIGDELRRSWEQTALLSRNVDQSLSNVHISAPASWSNGDSKLPSLPVPERNPIWQTNSHLSELANTVMQLVDVARQQAELSQAIRTSADLALKYAVQSGEEAKAATLLARKSVRLTLIAIVVAIIAAIAGIVVNYNLNNSADARLKEEIHVLGDISGKLQQLNERAVISPVTSLPKSQGQANKPSQPASAR